MAAPNPSCSHSRTVFNAGGHLSVSCANCGCQLAVPIKQFNDCFEEKESLRLQLQSANTMRLVRSREVTEARGIMDQAARNEKALKRAEGKLIEEQYQAIILKAKLEARIRDLESYLAPRVHTDELTSKEKDEAICSLQKDLFQARAYSQKLLTDLSASRECAEGLHQQITELKNRIGRLNVNWTEDAKAKDREIEGLKTKCKEADELANRLRQTIKTYSGGGTDPTCAPDALVTILKDGALLVSVKMASLDIERPTINVNEPGRSMSRELRKGDGITIALRGEAVNSNLGMRRTL